MIYHTVIVKYL